LAFPILLPSNLVSRAKLRQNNRSVPWTIYFVAPLPEVWILSNAEGILVAGSSWNFAVPFLRHCPSYVISSISVIASPSLRPRKSSLPLERNYSLFYFYFYFDSEFMVLSVSHTLLVIYLCCFYFHFLLWILCLL